MKNHLLVILFFLSLTSAAQWTEVQTGIGFQSIQGDINYTLTGQDIVNPALYIAAHTRSSKRDRWCYGMSFNFYTVGGDYSSTKKWLNGHFADGYGISTELSARYYISNKADYRFVRDDWSYFVEVGIASHYFNYRSTYHPFEGNTEENKNNSVAYINANAIGAHLAGGVQYQVSRGFGYFAKLTWQGTTTDFLDGVSGHTGIDDYLLRLQFGTFFSF